jgi:hypothetical protein
VIDPWCEWLERRGAKGVGGSRLHVRASSLSNVGSYFNDCVGLVVLGR